MSQTNWIGAFIAIGFIAYVIANNQLSGYLSVLGIGSQSGNSTSTQSTASNINNIVDQAAAQGLF